MEGNEMASAVAFAETFGEGFRDLTMEIVFDGTVTAENPNDGVVAITVGEPFRVGTGVFRREDFRPCASFSVPFVAPCRQKADIESELVGAFDNGIDMLPIWFVRTCQIVVHQRLMTVSIRLVQAVAFC